MLVNRLRSIKSIAVVACSLEPDFDDVYRVPC